MAFQRIESFGNVRYNEHSLLYLSEREVNYDRQDHSALLQALP